MKSINDAVKILKSNRIEIVRVLEKRNVVEIARTDKQKYIERIKEMNIGKEITVCWRM